MDKKKKSDTVPYASFFISLKKNIYRDYVAYLMFIPVGIFYLLFAYKPMYGLIIAFKNFSPMKGIINSPWADNFGFQHFLSFFHSYYFWRLIKNTLVISIASLIFGFPAPIILALLINEVKHRTYKSLIQSLVCIPHFISMVVICSMVTLFVSNDGFITKLLADLHIVDGSVSMLTGSSNYVPIYIISEIWQSVGWGAVIYLSALSGVDMDLYDAAKIDGANHWQCIIHVTLPAITTTIIVMFILKIGTLMSIGVEKTILLYNPEIYNTADIISSFVYRKGLLESDWSFSAAVGLFNSLINVGLVITANRLCRKFTNMSLW
jgi:putative aldouronate transport system permease protein